MVLCPSCGEANPERHRYCGVCGTRLDSAASRATVRKVVTVLFCDMVGSTALGDRLDPEPLRRVLDIYLNRMRSILERHGGTIEKFMGDAVFAIFGVPTVREDDALRAVAAASEMRGSLAELRPELEERFGVEMEVRIGINTGEVVAPASNPIAAVTGDVVNVAARLEQAAGAGEILIGRDTFALVRGAVRAELLPPLELKGKPQPVTAYRLLQVMSGARGRARRSRSPMIGRDSELAFLQKMLREVTETATCHLITVIGEAGVGKSRLVSEFTDSAGATVLHGRCLSYQEGSAFRPIVQIIKSAAGISDAEERVAALAKLRALVEGEGDAASVARQLGSLIGSAQDAFPALEETYRAVRRLLEVTARERPVVARLEDVHWAEPEVLDLIEYIVDHSRDAPIMIVCEARTELLERRRAWGQSGRAATVSAKLDPLGNDQSSRLVENLLGRDRVEENVIQRIIDTAEGNPLFVEELVAMLIEQGSLDRRGDVWTLQTEPWELRMPLTIQTLLATRLEQLSHEERQVVQRAAVIGRLVYWRAVAELSPPELRNRVGAHLTSLSHTDLIHPERSDFEHEDAFAFHHSLVREAAYQATPKELRAELHERFANWLQEVARDREVEYEELIGYHLERAVAYRRELIGTDAGTEKLARSAATELASAGRRALARADMASTARLLERAATLLPTRDASRLDLIGDLALALSQNGQFARAADVLDATISSGAASQDPGLSARLQVEREIVRLEIEPGRTVAEARRAVEPAMESLRRLEDDRGLARGWQLIGIDHWSRCQAAQAERAFDRSLEHARRAGDRFIESESLALLLRAAFWGPTPVMEGISRCERIRVEHAGDHRTEAFALAVRAGFESLRGHFDLARRLQAEAEAMLTDLGLETERSGIEVLSFEIELLAGSPGDAERALRAGLAAAVRMGEGGQLALLNGLLARVLYLLGRLDEAELCTRRSEDAASADDIASGIIWRSVRAKIAARADRRDEARSLVGAALSIADKIDFINDRADALADAAEVEELSARPAEAVSLLRRAAELYERKGNLVSQRRASRHLELLRSPT